MNKTTNNINTKIMRLLAVAMTSLVFGYLGGWIFANNNSKTPSSSLVKTVILNEGELISDIAERVKPSVVSISVVENYSNSGPFTFGSSFPSAGAGTGIILTEDGLIVTNKHVVESGDSDGTEISIELSDGTVHNRVTFIDSDPFNDVAYLKIEDISGLTPAVLGDSSSVRVGDKVIAIGNALGEFDSTVTAGIISGLSRPIIAGNGNDAEQLQNLFQTDAAINPGNSGGPLVNISGEVIGINTAVSGEGQNIGFSIPIGDIKIGFESVVSHGELLRPYLGIRYISIDSDVQEQLGLEYSYGALITDNDSVRGAPSVIEGSPAQKAGLSSGDIILKINDIKIDEDNPLVSTISQYSVGTTLRLIIFSEGEEKEINLVLEAAPDNILQ